MTRLILPLAALAAAALVSCTGDDGPSPLALPDAEVVAASAAELSECPTNAPGEYADVDYIDFVRLDGITYTGLSVYAESPDAPLLGEPIGEVTCRVDGYTGRHYRSKDGHAAFLDPGTLIYSLMDYAPSFRVAADGPIGEGFRVYEASTNPRAGTGADLLDIRGKVTSIRVRGASGGLSRSTDVHDADEIASIVAMVLDSPVDHGERDNSELEQYQVEFHLNDGTIVVRAYWPETGELSRRIMLPPEFARLIPEVPD